jgi:hypothetical protein
VGIMDKLQAEMDKPVLEFGLQARSNVKWAKLMLQAHDVIDYTTTYNAGITYFIFKTPEDLGRAWNLVKQVIDSRLEQDIL